ncbi:hypothetical protein CLCR_07675 [Cladophialophora carrionii]|uniref:Uncharacterized protein n=1 Tax=Cladophialophora carrionii TaxID=86049 RepID=A0A1C1CPD8_9EURO|nr:hypothetical protein CLCR_07675 [Cladophialophora carrionii]
MADPLSIAITAMATIEQVSGKLQFLLGLRPNDDDATLRELNNELEVAMAGLQALTFDIVPGDPAYEHRLEVTIREVCGTITRLLSEAEAYLQNRTKHSTLWPLASDRSRLRRILVELRNANETIGLLVNLMMSGNLHLSAGLCKFVDYGQASIHERPESPPENASEHHRSRGHF